MAQFFINSERNVMMNYFEYKAYAKKIRDFLYNMKPNQVFELKNVKEENLADFKAISHQYLSTSKESWRYDIANDWSKITRNNSLPEQSFDDWLDCKNP